MLFSSSLYSVFFLRFVHEIYEYIVACIIITIMRILILSCCVYQYYLIGHINNTFIHTLILSY